MLYVALGRAPKGKTRMGVLLSDALRSAPVWHTLARVHYLVAHFWAPGALTHKGVSHIAAHAWATEAQTLRRVHEGKALHRALEGMTKPRCIPARTQKRPTLKATGPLRWNQ